MKSQHKKNKDKNNIDNKSVRLPSVRPGMPLNYVMPSKTDPLGSYTGIPEGFLKPVQDADDL